jgi:cyclopropane fatty-acyl-phospholipid synthase-like methyltransferase
VDTGDVARKVRDGYDLIAGRYMELVTRPRGSDPRDEWIDALLVRLAAGGSVLDVGCGPGAPTAAAIAGAGHRVTGIDISPRQIDLARAQVPSGRFLVGDVLEAEFEPGSFDAIVALFSLTHIARHRWESLFTRLVEWSQPQAWLLATFGMSDSGGWDEEDFLGLGATNWTNGFPPDTSQRLLRSVGFRIDRSDVVDDDTPFGPERWLWVLAQLSEE